MTHEFILVFFNLNIFIQGYVVSRMLRRSGKFITNGILYRCILIIMLLLIKVVNLNQLVEYVNYDKFCDCTCCVRQKDNAHLSPSILICWIPESHIWTTVLIAKANTSMVNVEVGTFPFKIIDITLLIFRSAITRKIVARVQKQGYK